MGRDLRAAVLTVADAGWDAHMRSGTDIGSAHFVRREYRTPDGRFVSYPTDREPPSGSVFVGITDNHLRDDGEWCGGYVRFKNVPEALTAPSGVANHELVTADPLTISPSLACRRCPSHGFIREGRWVPA
jgi:hypothetical protein